MKKTTGFLSVAIIAVLVAGAWLFSTPFQAVSDTHTAAPTVVIESANAEIADTGFNVTTIMADRVLGDINAPVSVIEYASMTCIHCSKFHTDQLPTIKKQLIESGKVNFIFREFPLDAVALKASMMARCVPEDKFFGILDVLFSNQKRWVGADDQIEAMGKLGRLAGLSEADFKTCIENKDLETALLEQRQKGSADFKVNSTPSFVFNAGKSNQRVEAGVIPAAKFAEIVESLTP